jgi:hypothetical protein
VNKATPVKENETPLLYIDINLGEDQQERIIVYEGDCAKELAKNFCMHHSKYIIFFILISYNIDLDEET